MGKKSLRRQRVVKEFEGVMLGDPRREQRALTVAGRLAMRPDASLPEAMGDDARLEGLYRHLSSHEVTFEQLLAPHVAQTVQRVSEAGLAYAIHDTTGFTFSGKVRREGLGRVNDSKDQGFLAHVTLAVAADEVRRPLGLLGVGTRARPDKEKPEHNEADRWSMGLNLAESHVDELQLIHVADREGDMYSLLAEATTAGWRFIIRCAQNRALFQEAEGEPRYLYDAIQGEPSRYRVQVPLSPRVAPHPMKEKRFPKRAGRQAELCFSATTIRLKRPQAYARSGPAFIEVNVVRAWEPRPPKGEAPVEWLLLTSEPIGTRQEIQAVIDGYRTRWVIEEYFCAVKTGCAFESKQLESAHTLFNLLAYCLVIAYAMLLMRTLSRAKSNRPATEVLTNTQLACLRLLSEGKLERNPTVTQALYRVAALGGHIKNNGDPGWRTLSRGWSQLLGAEAVYRLLKPAATSDQS